jgi:uncharacterized protein YciI
MHYLLFYEKAPDYAARQAPLQAPHLAHVQAAARSGELVLAGSLGDPNDGAAVLLFKADSPAVAEAFARADPYVIQGIVNKWWVRRWETVVGKDAAHLLPDERLSP